MDGAIGSKLTAGARAVLVGVQLPNVSDADLDASLDELGRLASTLGLRPVGRVKQHRLGTNAPAVLGVGKLRELARWTGGSGVVPSGAEQRTKGAKPQPEAELEPDDGWDDLGADDAEIWADDDAAESDGEFDDPSGAAPPQEQVEVVLFDHDLSPSQLRNLERATGAEVLDRSSVILHIFQRHARSREAKLQVEIARLKYLAPRLRATGGGGDRQRGGIGGKGAGESALELDRRRIRDRIAELKQTLSAVQRDAETRRERRKQHHTVALVGYTNAGKSSLMRALTGSDVLVQDQLFATLDTTVRLLQPPTRPRIFVSDTVGFIKKLPHDLVASFRSTLEEAREAALLLHVVDASDPAWRLQYDVTRAVLSEIGAHDNPTLLLLNKADRIDDAARAALVAELPAALVLSALHPADIGALHARILAFFEREMVDAEVIVPYRLGRLVHTIHESCRVLAEDHEAEGTRLRIRAAATLVDDLKTQLAASS